MGPGPNRRFAASHLRRGISHRGRRLQRVAVRATGTDASGGVSREAHEMSVLRMIRAGANPMTWLAIVSEWQRDWAGSFSSSPRPAREPPEYWHRVARPWQPPRACADQGQNREGACLGLLKRSAPGTSQFALRAVYAASRRKMLSS